MSSLCLPRRGSAFSEKKFYTVQQPTCLPNYPYPKSPHFLTRTQTERQIAEMAVALDPD